MTAPAIRRILLLMITTVLVSGCFFFKDDDEGPTDSGDAEIRAGGARRLLDELLVVELHHAHVERASGEAL